MAKETVSYIPDKKHSRITKDKKNTDPVLLNENEDDLVEEAFNKIKNIYFSHAKQSYFEIASYLAKTFFNDDFDLIRKKTPVPDMASSFNKLCEKLKSEDARLPKKSWLYNAVGLLADEKALKDSDAFQTYGNLSVSHRVNLLPIHDLEKKIELIQKIDEESLSVRDLQKKIIENRPKRKRKEQDTWEKQLNGMRSDLLKRKTAIQGFDGSHLDQKQYKEIEKRLDGLLEFLTEIIDNNHQA